uniref:Uncharacterized protein n=1 Tax=Pithovirus LCPAC103 TaxID=2506588 RepID=A0A481Z3L3_9VIRU|nr:MAG: hypothetical protein LCPAC103_01640 [Pithovirus LCPAC103]
MEAYVLASDLRCLLRKIPDAEDIMSKSPAGTNYTVDSDFYVYGDNIWSLHKTNVPYVVIKRLQRLTKDCKIHILKKDLEVMYDLAKKYENENITNYDTGSEALIEFYKYMRK